MNRSRTASLTLALFVSFLAATAQDSREVKKSVPLNNDGRLVIDTYKGGVTVSTWDKAEVDIVARIEADDQFFSDEDDAVKDTDIRISGSGDEVRVKSDYSHLRGHRRGFFGMFDENTSQPLVYYTVKMPRTAKLTVKDYKSNTSISDLQSDVSIDTYKGGVEVSNLSGSLELKTYKGDCRISFSKLSNDSRFETYKGGMTISLPKKSGFVLDCDLGKKASLRSDFDVEKRPSSRRHRDDDWSEPRQSQTVNGGGPKIRISSERGDFSLRQD